MMQIQSSLATALKRVPQEPRTVLFLHIPKTAGTSVRRVVGARFDEDATLAPADGAVVFKTADELDNYQFVAGHVDYEFAKLFRRWPVVITFLRNPIERAVSAFYFMRSLNPEEYTKAEYRRDLQKAQELSLPDFIRSEPAAAKRHLGNIQTWFLSDKDARGKSSAVDTAKKNLAHCDFVGLAERMRDSWALLSYNLGWELLDEPPRANRTQDRPTVEQLDHETVAAVAELTRLDAELYRFGTELFERRWRAILTDLLRMHSRTVRAATQRDGRLHVESPGDVPAGATPLPQGVYFTFNCGMHGSGWYPRERIGTAWCCWTGPSDEACLDFAVATHRDMILRFHVVHAVKAELLDDLEVRVNGYALSSERTPDTRGFEFEAAVPRSIMQARDGTVRIAVRVRQVMRPCEVDPANRDSRLLGIALDWVELSPACRVAG